VKKILLLLCFIFSISYASEKDPWMSYLEKKMQKAKEERFDKQGSVNDILSSIVYGNNQDGLKFSGYRKATKEEAKILKSYLDTLLAASKNNGGLDEVKLNKAGAIVDNQSFFDKSKTKVEKVNDLTLSRALKTANAQDAILKIKKDNTVSVFDKNTNTFKLFDEKPFFDKQAEDIKELKKVAPIKNAYKLLDVENNSICMKSYYITEALSELIKKCDWLESLSLINCGFASVPNFDNLKNLKKLEILEAYAYLEDFRYQDTKFELDLTKVNNIKELSISNHEPCSNNCCITINYSPITNVLLPKKVKILKLPGRRFIRDYFFNEDNNNIINNIVEFNCDNKFLEWHKNSDTNFLEKCYNALFKKISEKSKLYHDGVSLIVDIENKLIAKELSKISQDLNFEKEYLTISNKTANEKFVMNQSWYQYIEELLKNYNMYGRSFAFKFQDIDLQDSDIERLKQFDRIKSLKINNTFYRNIPKNIFQLSQLKELSITGKLENAEYPNDAKLYDMPDDIGLMQNLEVLKIQFFPLDKISDQIGKLKKLKQLSINRTNTNGLPKSIKDCSALTLLDLRDNKHLEWGDFFYQIDHPEDQVEYIHYEGEDLDYLGIYSLRYYFGDRFLHNQSLEEEEIEPVSTLTIQEVYEELDNNDSYYKINRNKLKATKITEIPQAKSLDGKKVLENFESIHKAVVGDEGKYKKYLGFIKALFNMPIDEESGEVTGWQVKSENKKDLQNMLAYTLEQILLENDQDNKKIEFQLFEELIEKCPAGQREGFDYLFKAFLGNVYSGENDLESIIKTKIIEFKENLFYNLVLDGQNQQNVHGLSFYKDKLKDELGLNSFLSSDLIDTTGVFTEKHGNPAEILKAFYGQFNPDNLAKYMSNLYKPDNSKDKVNYPISFQNVYSFLEKQSDIDLKQNNWWMDFFDINPEEDFDNKAKLIESGAKILLERLGYIIKTK
jgi:hypothetical protein